MISPTLAAALLALQSPATAAAAPSEMDRAIAAGYKASMLCSGIFNAGRTEAQVEAVELKGIYREYQPIVDTLKADIDRARGTVSVSYGAGAPRVASWIAGQGCVNWPVGWSAAAIPGDRPMPPAGADPRPWPQGDGGIAPKTPVPLARAVTKAFDANGFGTGTRSVGVVVVRDGTVVAERYAEGFGPFVSNRTWSVAKSLAGTLVGMAVHQGAVEPDRAAAIPEWHRGRGDPRAPITLDSLLRMASGLASDTAGNRTDAIYFGGVAVTDEATNWPVAAKPGTVYRYANNDTLLALRALREAMGDVRYARLPQSLFGPLGMKHTVAETDWRGNYILSSQVWSTTRDLARFGLLYLNDGVWNGTRLLPEGWVKYVTTPSGPQPEDREFGYGATFWLMNRSPGIPADTYAGFGNRGQYVVIVPSRKVVIVRRGEDPAGSPFDIAKFTTEVLAALK